MSRVSVGHAVMSWWEEEVIDLGGNVLDERERLML